METGTVVRRCSRCILPANYPDIGFDGNGVCRVCREFDEKYAGIDWEARRRRLEKILDRYRGKGGKYDCLATPHSSYLFRLRTGFGKYEYLYANMVRAGVISREEALRVIDEREPREAPEGFDEFLAGLGLDRGILEGIEKKSVFGSRGRPGGMRKLAIAIRERLR